jgi:hypothetical protein
MVCLEKNQPLAFGYYQLFFSLLAVVISTNLLNQDLNLVISAAIIWVVLLASFLATKDT